MKTQSAPLIRTHALRLHAADDVVIAVGPPAAATLNIT